MQLLPSLQGLLGDVSASTRLSLLAFSWIAAATIAHFITACWLLRRFSREGPVLPVLLPQLEEKWVRAVFGLRIWIWLRRVGLALSFAAVLLAGAELGLYVRTLLSAGPGGPDWRLALAEHVDRVVATVLVMGIAITFRVVLGGLANIIAVRAQNFVTASNSLISREEVQRMKTFLNRVESGEIETMGPTGE